MRVLRLTALLALCALLASAETRKLTILHTNDLHAKWTPLPSGQGGFARLAAAIRKERANCGQCVLLDAGDVVQGSPVSTLFRGLPIFEALNKFGIDASTFGNHDFDYGWEQAQRFLKAAKYPIVAANVVNAAGQPMTKPYVTLKANGLRIGVVGAVTASLPQLSTPKALGEWRALPLATLRPVLADLKGRVDLIVLLGHLVAAEEDEALKTLTEVAVTVSGHAHNGIPAPSEADGRVMVRLRSYAQELGRLDLDYDTEARRIAKWSWKRTPIVPGMPEAGDVAKVIAGWEKKVAKQVDVPIARAKRALARTDLKPLMEKAMMDAVKADAAFMNPGGIRDTIPAGVVLARHIWNVMPFDNRVVVGVIKGRDLPVKATAGKQIDPDRDYRFAVTDFTAENQGEMGTAGLKFPETGPVFRDLLIDWVKKHPELN